MIHINRFGRTGLIIVLPLILFFFFFSCKKKNSKGNGPMNG